MRIWAAIATLFIVTSCWGQIRPGFPAHVTAGEQLPSHFVDEATDTLRHDDNRPAFVFRFPDAYGDDWRNMRFVTPAACRLLGALFVFPRRGTHMWTTGDPDLLSRVWMSGADSLPDVSQILLTDTLGYSSFAAGIFDLDSVWSGAGRQWVFVDFSRYAIDLPAGGRFHLGYSAILNSADDSLAILADRGSPETDYAAEWYNGRFVRLRDGWRGVNLFIRALVQFETAGFDADGEPQIPAAVVLHPAYPNPFNPVATVAFQVADPGFVRLTVFDLLGRQLAVPLAAWFEPGRHRTVIDGSGWSSGMYYLHLETNGTVQTQHIVLQK